MRHLTTRIATFESSPESRAYHVILLSFAHITTTLVRPPAIAARAMLCRDLSIQYNKRGDARILLHTPNHF